jgi:hypothetical protein
MNEISRYKKGKEVTLCCVEDARTQKNAEKCSKKEANAGVISKLQMSNEL